MMSMQSIDHWCVDDNVLILKPRNGIIAISFTDEDIIRLRYTTDDAFEEEDTCILDGSPQTKEFALTQKCDCLEISSRSIKAEIHTKPFAVNIQDINGKEILSTPHNFLSSNGNAKTVSFNLMPQEHIYGLGQDPMAKLDHRDQERRMWQQWGHARRSGNGGIPFMMSTNGYGILLNNPWASRFAIGKASVAENDARGDDMAPAPWPWDSDSGYTHPERTDILLDGGDLDLFIICRPKLYDILQGYFQLTGYAPMPPKWALGFMQCKNRYRSQQELLHIGRTMRQKQIPCDVLIIDWLWFKEFGDLEWFKKDWPAPEAMLKELSNMGFKVMQAQHPFVEKNSLKYEQFKQAGYLNDAPGGARPTFDHTNPEARKAWWQEIHRLYKQGIKGYWTDMGELEEHKPGTVSFMGPYEKVHNIYSLMWVKGLYEGQRADFDQRVFSLPRTAYAGIQKYGAAMWSGDIDASWEVLKDQVIIGQGVSMSGQSYWTTDMGGFITGSDFSPELYIRWFQWGTFCSIFRTHGTRPGNEPWSFGAQAEAICKKYIELRYSLMPYIYTCARAVTEEGRPIMRPMCIEYPNDLEAVNSIYQFMFGPSILVAPVLEKGARSREVYLPEGYWYDFWTGRKYTGETTVTVSAPLDTIPLFVREGSIIPMCPVMQYTDEKSLNTIMLNIYPGKNSRFEMYEDDGITYDYEKGKYAKTLIEFEQDQSMKINIYPVDGCYISMPQFVDYRIMLHDMAEPAFISAKNWSYDEVTCLLTIECEDMDRQKGLEIEIETDQSSTTQDGAKLQEIEPEVDYDIENDGLVTVHLTMENRPGDPDIKYKAYLVPPKGWNIIQDDTIYEGTLCQCSCHSWHLKPYADALPAVNRSSVKVEFTSEQGLFEANIPIAWGSGCITRCLTIGSFDNDGDRGLESVYPPEEQPDMPFYKYYDGEMAWSRYTDDEYNCFGYVDMRKNGTNITDGTVQGTGYAKCSIWSPDDRLAYIRISSEKGIKIWLNGHEAFVADDVLLDEMIKQPIELKEGWNTIMVKSTLFAEKPYSGREYGFNLSIVDKDGHVMEDLLYKA